MAANETKRVGLAKLKHDNKGIAKEDLQALAYNKCQDEMRKLYQNNSKHLKDLADLKDQLKGLEKKVADVAGKETKIIDRWLNGFPDLQSMASSQLNKLKLQADAAAKHVTGGESGRKSWTPYSIVQQLEKETPCSEGWLSFKALKGNFNAPSIDVLVKRFQSNGKDMLKKMEKGGDSLAVQVSKEFKVKKKAGEKAFDYYFNKKDVIKGLMETKKYKEEASTVEQ